MSLPANQIVRVPSVLALLPLDPLVAVMVPKLLFAAAVPQFELGSTLIGEPHVLFGLLNRGVLVKPNISALNWNVKRSVSLKLRKMLRSASKIPGPRN